MNTFNKNKLIEHFYEHLRFLKKSCHDFDKGDLSEAKRIAVSIRVLLHDSKNNSRSILKQLGLKEEVQFFDTSFAYVKDNLFHHLGLVKMRMSSEAGVNFKAILDDNNSKAKYVSFDNWWNKLVIKLKTNHSYTRRQLVAILANKDGGAHVDPNIDTEYLKLKRGKNVGVFAENDFGQIKFAEKLDCHSLRQIAYELIYSFEHQKEMFDNFIE